MSLGPRSARTVPFTSTRACVCVIALVGVAHTPHVLSRTHSLPLNNGEEENGIKAA